MIEERIILTDVSKVTTEVSPEPKTGNFLFFRKEDNA